MLLMEQILGEMPHLEREWNHERAMLAYACSRAVRVHIIPTLEDLFALNYWDFVQSERFYHWMSRCLVEVLLHQTNEIAFAELLTRFDDSTTGWEVFARSYSVERIERLWWERIREIARGT